MAAPLPLILALATGGASGLTVHVAGVRSASGVIRCMAHQDAASFPTKDEPTMPRGAVAAQVGEVVIHLDLTVAGDYAVSCYHDENANGRIDLNFLGIPKEGVASSNDAKGHFGPPTFADAHFHYAGGDLPLTLHMVY